jgi:hypothetical protein
MSTKGLILVTGAAGRVGGVGGAIVEAILRRGPPFARRCTAMMNGPMRCGRLAPRWSLAT